ncbi:MAG: CCA tRNA nucleotidyltransferase [Promethearchaeota archaeon]
MSKRPKENNSLNDFIPIFRNSIPSELHEVFEVLWEHDKDVYIVGGAVRDCLLGFPVTDFDIITNAYPEEGLKFLSAKGIKVKPIGGEFGTILAILGKNTTFDISTFRQEIFSFFGPPEIVFVNTLEEDLPRRDFTINAIVYDPRTQKFVDKFNGFHDLQEGKIKTIGDALTRFTEDGTRIIRLARFISQFDLEVHSEVLAALQSIGKNARFFSYSTLQKEFFKLLSLQDPRRGLSLLWTTEILTSLVPNFPISKVEDVEAEKILFYYRKIPSRDVWIRFFGLLLFLSEEKSQTEENWLSISLDLQISSKEQKKLMHIFHSWLKFPSFPETKKLKRWIRATGINTSEDLSQLIFLKAELEERSDILIKKEKYLKGVQIILDSFRRRSSDNNSLS